MKRTSLIFILTVSVLITVSAFTFFDSLHSAGIAFETGSPYDFGSTCAQPGCHSGGTTTPTVTITSNPAFGIGNTFTPGMTYTINVIGSGSYPKYGFDLEILNSKKTTALDQGVFGNPVSNNN